MSAGPEEAARTKGAGGRVELSQWQWQQIHCAPQLDTPQVSIDKPAFLWVDARHCQAGKACSSTERFRGSHS